MYLKYILHSCVKSFLDFKSFASKCTWFIQYYYTSYWCHAIPFSHGQGLRYYQKKMVKDFKPYPPHLPRFPTPFVVLKLFYKSENCINQILMYMILVHRNGNCVRIRIIEYCTVNDLDPSCIYLQIHFRIPSIQSILNALNVPSY
jgi:hypothetical protein